MLAASLCWSQPAYKFMRDMTMSDKTLYMKVYTVCLLLFNKETWSIGWSALFLVGRLCGAKLLRFGPPMESQANASPLLILLWRQRVPLGPLSCSKHWQQSLRPLFPWCRCHSGTGQVKAPSPYSPQTFKLGSVATGPVFSVGLKDALPNSSVSKDDSTQEKALVTILITLVQEILKIEDTTGAAEAVAVTIGTHTPAFFLIVFFLEKGIPPIQRYSGFQSCFSLPCRFFFYFFVTNLFTSIGNVRRATFCGSNFFWYVIPSRRSFCKSGGVTLPWGSCIPEDGIGRLRFAYNCQILAMALVSQMLRVGKLLRQDPGKERVSLAYVEMEDQLVKGSKYVCDASLDYCSPRFLCQQWCCIKLFDPGLWTRHPKRPWQTFFSGMTSKILLVGTALFSYSLRRGRNPPESTAHPYFVPLALLTKGPSPSKFPWL